MVSDPTRSEASATAELFHRLHDANPEAAQALERVMLVIVDEAIRNRRFANALAKALSAAEPVPKSPRPRRRSPGVIDPFQVFAEGGAEQLRNRLRELDLEQLRDIVAEHGMDHDRLAMKWKDPLRVVDRVVEKVTSRASKGAAFRDAGANPNSGGAR